MRAHVESFHLKQRFPCPVEGCTFTSSRQNYIDGHIRAAHSQAAFTCPVDRCAFRSAYSCHVSRHRQAKHENKVLRCSYKDCSFSTSWPSSLKQHVKRKHASTQRHLACGHACVARESTSSCTSSTCRLTLKRMDIPSRTVLLVKRR